MKLSIRMDKLLNKLKPVLKYFKLKLKKSAQTVSFLSKEIQGKEFLHNSRSGK